MQGVPQTLGAAVYSARTSRRVLSSLRIRPPPGKSQDVYTTMWGKIRVLVGEGAGAERVVAMDFERSSVNAPDATSPYAEVGGRYFHLGKSVYRRSQGLGLASQYGSGDEFKIRVKKLTALEFHPPRVFGSGVRTIGGSARGRRAAHLGLLRGDVRGEARVGWQAEAAVRQRLVERGKPNAIRFSQNER